MIIRKMADTIVHHYHSDSVQLKLEAESDGTSLTEYMKSNPISDLHEGLKGYIKCINGTVPRQRKKGFNKSIYKKRRLCLNTMIML